MRIIALINAYNEVNLVDRCIKNISDYADKVVITDIDWPTGKKVATDGTHEKIMELIDNSNYNNLRYIQPQFNNTGNPRVNEAIIKTQLMNSVDPRDGDWIWIVEADEFYLSNQLKGLKERLLLGHKSISEHNKHWLTISALTFAYNLKWAYYGYHGRFFRYKKGSKFTLSNHFSWPSGEISTDAHRWHIPIAHLCQFHLKFVKPLDRLAQRWTLNSGPDDLGYENWIESVFKIWPSDPSRAHGNNKGGCGWVKGQPTELFYYDGPIPSEIEDLKIDLYNALDGKNAHPFWYGQCPKCNQIHDMDAICKGDNNG